MTFATGLAHPGLAFEEERAVELEGEVNRRRQAAVGDVELLAQRGLEVVNGVEIQDGLPRTGLGFRARGYSITPGNGQGRQPFVENERLA
jgi:hypothetical protein